ncbi:bifunctional DNA primase/polymerase [Methylobacterium nonmethylotrophicum]|uniref:DNA primase/polymerase bifunctional N-terminal domain-containing protein n=1 Tax=Methylobacterium nonmethylotrophicum TaxID=1141884 RepID=A0A4Z0NIC5_9HYPH|nr:bifunctional DNA primase/polymerase [Methylobacterium nonmethylotrophicum]TGD95857.1 hypothetical protein EU555_25990 [Methylobacterium nonmethylotrophicum]
MLAFESRDALAYKSLLLSHHLISSDRIVVDLRGLSRFRQNPDGKPANSIEMAAVGLKASTMTTANNLFFKESAATAKGNLDFALKYAELGFQIFPVDFVVQGEDGSWESSRNRYYRQCAVRDGREPRLCPSPGKEPLVQWKDGATSSPEQIHRWFTKKHGGWPRANIGIATGPRSGIWVLDVDGPKGKKSLDDLIAKYGALPDTAHVITHSSGEHYYFRWPEGCDLRNTASALGEGLDTRADGGYVVAPPSRGVSGNLYMFASGRSVAEIEIARAPQWLQDLAFSATKARTAAVEAPSRSKEKKSHKNVSVLEMVDAAATIPEIAEKLALIGDGEGQRGFDSTINEAACAYFRFQGTEAPAGVLKATLRSTVERAPVKRERENYARYLSDEYLDRRIEQAREYICNSESAGNEERNFIFDDYQELIDALNRITAVVWVGDAMRFLIQENDHTRFVRQQDARNALAPYKYAVEVADRKGNKNTKVKAGFDVWIESDRRRQYEKKTFDPSLRHDASVFNTYSGLGINPMPGDWSLMQAHLFDNICHGSLILYRALLSWIAQLLQQPGRKLGSAVVLRGVKGCGKSIVADWLRRIIGDKHARKISNPRHLTGQFNSHFGEAILVVMEEAYWAGDHSVEGMLKDFITSDDIMLERKGIDAEEVKNYSRLLVISNNDWVVPAGHGERRFMVFDVGSGKAQDTSYFGALDKQMRDGGAAAMVHDLLSYDFDEAVLRKPPRTAGLVDQIKEGLRPDERWFYSMLMDGHVPDREDLEWQDNQPLEVPAATLRDSFNDFVPQYRGGQVTPNVFGQFLRRMIPQLPAPTRPGAKHGGERARHYVLPPLSELRSAFKARYGISFEQDTEKPEPVLCWAECLEARGLFATRKPSTSDDKPVEGITLPSPANDQAPASDAA